MFSRFFKSSSPDVLPPAVNVYRNKNRYLVAATNRYDIFRSPNDTCCTVSYESAESELGECILDCLSKSRVVASKEVFDDELSEFFKFAEVGGWEDFEPYWDHVLVAETPDGQLKALGYQRCQNGGYVTNQEPRDASVDASDLGNEVISIFESISGEAFVEEE